MLQRRWQSILSINTSLSINMFTISQTCNYEEGVVEPIKQSDGSLSWHKFCDNPRFLKSSLYCTEHKCCCDCDYEICCEDCKRCLVHVRKFGHTVCNKCTEVEDQRLKWPEHECIPVVCFLCSQSVVGMRGVTIHDKIAHMSCVCNTIDCEQPAVSEANKFCTEHQRVE